jgi:hypothetical protein
MNKDGQQSFLDILLELGQRFSNDEQHEVSNEQAAADLVHLVLETRRRCHGVVGDTPEGDAVDADTIAKMTGWDADDPALLTAEKVLRRFATGRGVDGVVLLKRAITDRQLAISDEQRRRASAPREFNQLQALIERMVRDRPTISAKELEKRLHQEIGNGVVQDMDDTEITLAYGTKTSVKVSGLKDRLTDAKKKIAEAG